MRKTISHSRSHKRRNGQVQATLDRVPCSCGYSITSGDPLPNTTTTSISQFFGRYHSIVRSMSDRIPYQPREDLTSEQQTFYDHFHKTVSRNAPHPGAAERAGKSLFPVLAVLPSIGKLQVDLMAQLEDEAPSLPQDARETASLVVVTYFRAAFVIKVHSMNAIRLELLSESQSTTITQGSKPGDLNERCSLAYDVASHLLEKRGPLPQDLWKKGVETFGEEGTVCLVHLVALMSWTAMGMNAVDVKAPKKPPGQDGAEEK